MIFNEIEVEIPDEIIKSAVKTVRKKVQQHKKKLKRREEKERRKSQNPTNAQKTYKSIATQTDA